MSDQHVTATINGVEVLSKLIDSVQKSVDRGNEETREEFRETRVRLEKIEGNIGDLKHVDATLSDGVSQLRTELHAIRLRVEKLEDDRNADRSTREEDRDERRKERAAIISHVAKLETSLSKTNTQVGENTKEQRKANEAIGAIVNELGIEDRVALGRDVKPDEPKPIPALAKLDRRAKSSAIVQTIIALGVIASLIERALHGL